MPRKRCPKCGRLFQEVMITKSGLCYLCQRAVTANQNARYKRIRKQDKFIEDLSKNP